MATGPGDGGRIGSNQSLDPVAMNGTGGCRHGRRRRATTGHVQGGETIHVRNGGCIDESCVIVMVVVAVAATVL